MVPSLNLAASGIGTSFTRGFAARENPSGLLRFEGSHSGRSEYFILYRVNCKERSTLPHDIYREILTDTVIGMRILQPTRLQTP